MTKKTFRSPISEEFVSLISQHPPQWRIETPTEIAKRAVKDGIHANEALQKISGRWGASDTTLALTLFIESLCNKNSALILEYTIFPVLLTTRTGNPNTVRRLSVISADKSFADALRILFENGGPSMLESVASLPAASSYGSIVCVPPMGHSAAGMTGSWFSVSAKLTPLSLG